MSQPEFILWALAIVCGLLAYVVHRITIYLTLQDDGVCVRHRMSMEAKYDVVIRGHDETLEDLAEYTRALYAQAEEEEQVEEEPEAEMRLHGLSVPASDQKWPVPSPST